MSPEFEIALYTLCFLCGRFEDNDGQSSRTPAQLGPYRVDVICHKFQQARPPPPRPFTLRRSPILPPVPSRPPPPTDGSAAAAVAGSLWGRGTWRRAR